MEFSSDNNSRNNRSSGKHPKKVSLEDDISWLKEEFQKRGRSDNTDSISNDQSASERRSVETGRYADLQRIPVSASATLGPTKRTVRKASGGNNSSSQQDAVPYAHTELKKEFNPLLIIIPLCLIVALGVGLFFFLHNRNFKLQNTHQAATGSPVSVSTPVPSQQTSYTPTPTPNHTDVPVPVPTDSSVAYPSVVPTAATAPDAAQSAYPSAMLSEAMAATATPMTVAPPDGVVHSAADVADTADAPTAAPEESATAEASYFSIWTAERLYSFLADGELTEDETVEESASTIKYSGLVDLVSVQIEADSPEAPVSSIHIMDVNTTGRVEMIYKSVNLLFAGTDATTVRSWVTAHLYQDVSTKFSDVNLIIRHLESGHIDFYLCDDAHLGVVPPASTADDAGAIS